MDVLTKRALEGDVKLYAPVERANVSDKRVVGGVSQVAVRAGELCLGRVLDG